MHNSSHTFKEKIVRHLVNSYDRSLCFCPKGKKKQEKKKKTKRKKILISKIGKVQKKRKVEQTYIQTNNSRKYKEIANPFRIFITSTVRKWLHAS